MAGPIEGSVTHCPKMPVAGECIRNPSPLEAPRIAAGVDDVAGGLLLDESLGAAAGGARVDIAAGNRLPVLVHWIGEDAKILERAVRHAGERDLPRDGALEQHVVEA